MAKYHYKYRRPQRRRLPFKKILWCLAALMLLAYPFWEATTLTVEEHTLYVTDLPANLKNLKIVFASDIHQCAWFSQSRVNELIPGEFFRCTDSAGADLFHHCIKRTAQYFALL